jgi:hypothetical protein
MLHLGKLLALPTNIRLSLKCLLMANTLAYYKKFVTYCLKRFITMAPGANVIKLFKAVSYKF